jgi:hypothetical protein
VWALVWDWGTVGSAVGPDGRWDDRRVEDWDDDWVEGWVRRWCDRWVTVGMTVGSSTTEWPLGRLGDHWVGYWCDHWVGVANDGVDVGLALGEDREGII